MNKLNAQKAALSVAVFLALWHVVWSLLVATGLAQSIYNVVLWAHMVHIPFVIGPFDAIAAGTLIAMTFVAGYVLGWVFAYVWNHLHR